mgnify:CR=1 FL=1
MTIPWICIAPGVPAGKIDADHPHRRHRPHGARPPGPGRSRGASTARPSTRSEVNLQRAFRAACPIWSVVSARSLAAARSRVRVPRTARSGPPARARGRLSAPKLWRSIMAPERIVASGLAIPCPQCPGRSRGRARTDRRCPTAFSSPPGWPRERPIDPVTCAASSADDDRRPSCSRSRPRRSWRDARSGTW